MGPALNHADDRDEDAFADDELLKALEAEYGIEGDFTVRTLSSGLGCNADSSSILRCEQSSSAF